MKSICNKFFSKTIAINGYLILVIGALGFLNLSHANESLFELETQGLKAPEIESVTGFLHEIESAFPEALKSQLAVPIQIDFRDFPDAPLTAIQCPEIRPEEPNSIQTAIRQSERTRNELSHWSTAESGPKITLNLKLIPEILAGPDHSTRYECGHKNFYHLAAGTIIYQIAWHLPSQPLIAPSFFNNQQYQKLSHWQTKWNWSVNEPWVLGPKNQRFNRTLDPLEFKDIQAHFAVNLEYFLIDPDYGCRRPSLSQYFIEVLGVARTSSCSVLTQIPIYSYDSPTSLDWLNLNPDRIYQIHYYQVSPGSDPESLLGHAALLIMGCNPQIPEIGPACLDDPDYHFVVSYDADYTKKDLWSGLTGQYPLRPRINRASPVTKNYTQSQLRNIEHTPLQLNPEEKKSIIYQILEQYWDYETPYYFFNQNCASEITDLLQGTLDPARMCRFKPMTPTQIQSELAKIGYLRPEESIFYRSSEDQLQKAYSALYENIWWDYTLHTYLNNTNALKRRKKIHKWIQSILDHQGFHASAYSLEQAAEQNLRQPSAFSHLYELELKIQSLAYLKLETKILAILSEAETPEIPVHDRKKKLALLHHYRESFTFLSSKNQLKNQINTGYGIPLETDLDLSKLQNGFHKIKKANQDINAWSQSVLKEDHLELDIIRRNLELLKECLAVETREDSHPVSKF